MRVKVKKKYTVAIIVCAFFILLAFNCRSTSVEDGDVTELIASENQIFDLADFEKEPSDSCWIFVRLYQPSYSNPLVIENFLKNCIGLVDVVDEKFSHAAISFSLDDNFYGLTSSNPEQNLALESCTNIESNIYMSKCDPIKSIQYTYAIKVSPEEYKMAKAIVEYYYTDPRTRYDVGLNFRMARHGIRRKLFRTEEKQQFGAVPDKDYEKTFTEDYDFICSSFVAFILANSVDSVHEYFLEKKIDVDYVMPSDLAFIPGMERVFKSTWAEYNNVAAQVAEDSACFAKYFNPEVLLE